MALQTGARQTRRTIITGAAAATFAALAPPARAESWPVRPVKIIVPVAAGTATDLTARIFGEKLGSLWGQPIVVDNKTGGDGLVALGSFAATADDHTLLFSFSTAVSLNPQIYAKLPYDPAVDLVPITTTSEVVFAIAVPASSKAQTMADLTADIRANPGKLNWAAAPGLPRFVVEKHRADQKLDMVYVGYTKTGNAVIDLGEGRIQMLIAALNTLTPVIDTGKARVLAVASTSRAASLPSIPNVVEAGFPGLAVPAVGCAYGAKGMPAWVRDRIARDIDTIAQDKVLIDQMEKVGQIVRRSSPAALAQTLAEQRVQLKALAEVMAAAQ